ncbi:hypothetical protein [Pseudomonas viridiflava]|uniref:hypothetical protein n=1 Tax=Pseudomonas viridiflava TaxID=33069 RepID=UPI000F04DF01|nr:hypothetical protein [Pseudomonas viridiflava]
MSYLLLLKESLLSRLAIKTATPQSFTVQPEPMKSITAEDADAGQAHLDQFVDGVEWETLLVDLACFNDGPEYSAQARF